MNINDLKEGDILLFSPEKGSFISWAITFLTDAPVSHAAMFYNEKEQSIIEETPPQVKTGLAAERFKDREIFVSRLNIEEDLPISPVIKKATDYLNDAEPYDKSGLYIVGLLLIYKKITLETPVQKVMIKILKKLTKSITDSIHRHHDPGKLPMVCSQFVAHCYSEAGDKYKLKIKNGILRKNALMQDDSFNLLDQVMKIVKSGERKSLQTLLSPTLKIQDEPSLSGEELCRELKEAFEQTPVKFTSGITDELTDELIEAVFQFAKAHHSVSSGGKELQNTLPDKFGILQALKDYEDMYVFPGDLLNHCENLEDIGTIK